MSLLPKENNAASNIETPRTLVFDLETKFLADEVGGWTQIRKMGLSLAVVYSVEDARFTTYLEDDVEYLIRALNDARLVVGYNIVRFDYEVLRGYPSVPLRRGIPTVDMMVSLKEVLGFRPKLHDIAHATLGVGKSGDGLDAVRWFRQGRMDQLAAYCQQDVQVTHDIYQFGRTRRFVRVPTYYGVKEVPVGW